MDIQIILPKGALGADESDDLLDSILREIANATPHEQGSWVNKYGNDFENDVFMMHSYCWCEKEDCVWCAGCDCPQSAFHYFVDGKEVTHEEFSNFFVEEVDKKCGLRNDDEIWLGNYDDKTKRKWHYLANKANKRRTSTKDSICDYCTGEGIFSKHGSIAGMGAPNFWHKPSGFRVWWYKSIGRDTKTHGKVNLPNMLQECLESLKDTV